ncbi:MAG: glycosyltransferase [Burkholderiaceae bacterium]
MKSPIGLSVSIVSYFHDLPILSATLDSLLLALRQLSQTMPLTAVVVVVDNSEQGCDADRLKAWLATRDESDKSNDQAVGIRLHVSHINDGYGAGNNRGQTNANSVEASQGWSTRLTDIPAEHRWVLILNPDVILAEDALLAGIQCLQQNPASSMLSPRAVDENGKDLFLAHRYPSWRVLGLRALAPGIAISGKPAWASALMHRYECRDLPPDQMHTETVCASGCFMLMAYTAWRESGGFDERFFLYFEDYDLSCRLLALGPVTYAPSVRIQHAGGQAASKQGRHRQWFISSAMRFFRYNGWPARRRRPNPASLLGKQAHEV